MEAPLNRRCLCPGLEPRRGGFDSRGRRQVHHSAAVAVNPGFLLGFWSGDHEQISIYGRLVHRDLICLCCTAPFAKIHILIHVHKL